jgi:hypothetical protein
MESAGPVYQFMARSQVKMIGISQDDLSAGIFEHFLGERFDRASRSDRHKCGRLERAMGGFYEAGSRSGTDVRPDLSESEDARHFESGRSHGPQSILRTILPCSGGWEQARGFEGV